MPPARRRMAQSHVSRARTRKCGGTTTHDGEGADEGDCIGDWRLATSSSIAGGRRAGRVGGCALGPR